MQLMSKNNIRIAVILFYAATGTSHSLTISPAANVAYAIDFIANLKNNNAKRKTKVMHKHLSMGYATACGVRMRAPLTNAYGNTLRATGERWRGLRSR